MAKSLGILAPEVLMQRLRRQNPARVGLTKIIIRGVRDKTKQNKTSSRCFEGQGSSETGKYLDGEAGSKEDGFDY